MGLIRKAASVSTAGFIGFLGLTALGTPASARGAGVTQTTSYTVEAASSTPIGVGTINSQFTQIRMKASGTAYVSSDPASVTGPSGIPGFTCALAAESQGRDPASVCLSETALIGALLFSVGPNGPWQSVTNGAVVTAAGAVNSVYVVFNDLRGEYTDNTGSYALTVVRFKPGKQP